MGFYLIRGKLQLRQTSVNILYVPLENMYQLNCEIAVNIAGYALTIIWVLAVVLIQSYTTILVSSGSDDNLLKQV